MTDRSVSREVAINYLNTTGIPYFLQDVRRAQVGHLSVDGVVTNWKTLIAISREAGIDKDELAEMISKKQATLKFDFPEPWQDTIRTCEITARA